MTKKIMAFTFHWLIAFGILTQMGLTFHSIMLYVVIFIWGYINFSQGYESATESYEEFLLRIHGALDRINAELEKKAKEVRVED